MNVEIGRKNIIIFFWNNEAEQLHFWEYINRDQTFILDSHWPFIYSVCYVTAHICIPPSPPSLPPPILAPWSEKALVGQTLNLARGRRIAKFLHVQTDKKAYQSYTYN